MNEKLTIIGGGNLGSAIAAGVLESGFIHPENLCVTRRDPAPLHGLQARGVSVLSDNREAVRDAGQVIFAVKPFQLPQLLAELKDVLDPTRQVIISTCTGVWIADILAMLGADFTVFRAMPNTAIAIRESMTCICAQGATPEQVEAVRSLFNQLGSAILIEEKLMDAATVLGACGTAFAMRYIRANIQGGVEIGFHADTAALIAAQTVKGAAQLLLTNHTHPEQEIDKVTTPQGCTIAGLNEMEHCGFSSSLIKGLTSSYRKIVREM